MRRTLRTAGILAIFWLVPVSFGKENAAARATPGTLRIATFNLEWLTESAHETRMAPWKSEGELEAHRRALARILARDVHADIVCVLESTSRVALDKLVAEPELRQAGYRVLHLESGDTGTGQDVAFLVRVPLDKFGGVEVRRFADTLALSDAGSANAPAPEEHRRNRKPARARLTKHAVVCLTSGSLKLCVMGVHLLAHPDDRGRTARREIQARIAAGLIRREIVARGYLPVVVGDFNDFDPAVALPEDSKGPRKVLGIFKDYNPSHPGEEMFNAAEKIAPASERYSAWWDKNKSGKREDDDPVSLIDHILLDKGLAQRLVKTEILHAAHDGSVSDHWPVVVELKQ